MRFEFIEVEKANCAVSILCEVLRVSRGGFYSWQKRPESARAIEDKRLTVKVKAIHRASRQTYGSPRIHDELKEEGVPILLKATRL